MCVIKIGTDLRIKGHTPIIWMQLDKYNPDDNTVKCSWLNDNCSTGSAIFNYSDITNVSYDFCTTEVQEQRKLLYGRFLSRSREIEKEDYDFLFRIKEFKYAILSNPDADLYYNEHDGMFHRHYYISTQNRTGNFNNHSSRSDNIDDSIIFNAVKEIFPLNIEELQELEDLRLEKEANRKEKLAKKKYTLKTKAPGKHNKKTWTEVKQIDPGYIEWMLSVSEDENLKAFLITL